MANQSYNMNTQSYNIQYHASIDEKSVRYSIANDESTAISLYIIEYKKLPVYVSLNIYDEDECEFIEKERYELDNTHYMAALKDMQELINVSRAEIKNKTNIDMGM